VRAGERRKIFPKFFGTFFRNTRTVVEREGVVFGVVVAVAWIVSHGLCLCRVEKFVRAAKKGAPAGRALR
jgi:hypothetical protein